jgi:hypothetical protein
VPFYVLLLQLRLSPDNVDVLSHSWLVIKNLCTGNGSCGGMDLESDHFNRIRVTAKLSQTVASMDWVHQPHGLHF